MVQPFNKKHTLRLQYKEILQHKIAFHLACTHSQSLKKNLTKLKLYVVYFEEPLLDVLLFFLPCRETESKSKSK